MLSLRITAPEGHVRMVPLDRHELTVGRTPDNVIVLEGSGVSGRHCAFLVSSEHCVLEDRGSTNGTFVNNSPVQRSGPLGERDKIYVGQFLLEVMHGTSGISVHTPTQAHMAARPTGPAAGLLIQREDRGWRDQHKRITRAAEQWNEAGRPDRLTLRPRELQRARAWVAKTPADRQDLISPLQRELIAASGPANTRRGVKRAASIGGIVLALGGVTAAAIMLWPEGTDDPVDASGTDEGPAEPEPDDSGLEPERPLDPDPPPIKPKIKEQIDHEVIPQETLEDIAQRYGVSVAKVAEWNLLNPDDPGLQPGDVVKIKKPTKRPLPQQRIPYEIEPEDTSWSKLSKRFGVPAKKLREYNPEVGKLSPGQEVVIWIDPRPYAPKQPRTAVPQYVVDRTAQAIGSPNAGTLENGIQIPDNPDLYKRRYEYIMWGSGYLVANVQKAVAQFRQDMDFDGTIVLADVSKRKGGPFSPHSSHQQGRDIDIWLPTVRGVFKEKYLNDDGDEKWGRRPNPEEVDWFATWGLVRALVDTGAVQNIFLDHTIQPKVYDAAKFLGVGDEELEEVIQWPRGPHSTAGVLSHSPAHIHHMHVRFKCAPYEKQCRKYTVRDE